MTFRLGLTGNIGMGKSTTAAMFKENGCEVWDADAAVHRAYGKDGSAVKPMGALFPTAVIDGAISREQLKIIIAKDPTALKKIESIVHPLLVSDRADLLQKTSADIVVFDVPLLFETGGDKAMDAVVCVSVTPEIQKNRVLSRGTMTEDQFEFILSKQMPISEKIAKADFVVQTDTLERAKEQVQEIVKEIRKSIANA